MRVSRTGAVVLALALGAPLIARAQDQDRGRWSGVARLDPGDDYVLRRPIDSRTDYVHRDRPGHPRRQRRPGILRGATAELIVRTARDNDLILDLESVTIGGHATPGGSSAVDSGNNNLTRDRRRDQRRSRMQVRPPAAGHAARVQAGPAPDVDA
jgi:hypothetical protein